MAPVREHSAQHLFPIVSKASCSRWTVTPHMDVTFSQLFPGGKVLRVYDFRRPSCSLPSLLLVATLVYNSFKMEYSGFSNTWTKNFQMFKLILEKAEEPEIKLPISAGSSKKQESSRKSIYFCFIDYTKAFDCVDHNKLWKILKEIGILDHLACLLRNLYAGDEATVKIAHETTDWFQIGKGVHQGCIVSPCLFNLYSEYIHGWFMSKPLQ